MVLQSTCTVFDGGQMNLHQQYVMVKEKVIIFRVNHCIASMVAIKAS